MAGGADGERQAVADLDRVAHGAGRLDPVQADPLVFLADVERRALVELGADPLEHRRNDLGGLESAAGRAAPRWSTFEPRRYEPSSVRST